MQQPIFFDAHTHPQFVGYGGERPEVIDRARKAGVKMIAVGTQFSTSEEAITLAKMYPDEMWATAGFHPNHLAHDHRQGGASWHHDTMEQREAVPEQFDVARMRELARQPEIVAIGECGLDYFRLGQGANREGQIARQKEVFAQHIEMAQEVKKPLMIHCRSAFPDLISMLNDMRSSLSAIPNPGVVHFFTGTIEDAKALLEIGFSFTFGGVITFTRDYDEVMRMIPLDRILSETDAPYVAPAPYRGRRNEPAYVVEVVKKLAELKGVGAVEMASHIAENAKRIFKISF